MDYKNAGVDIEAGYESVADFQVLFLLKISRKWKSRSFYQVQMAAAQR